MKACLETLMLKAVFVRFSNRRKLALDFFALMILPNTQLSIPLSLKLWFTN